jgi:hypothetical protein
MTSNEALGSQFVVDLGDLKLPSAVARRVEADIRSVVLRALADTDFGGGRRIGDFIVDQFPGRTLGLIIRPGPDGPRPLPLSIRDHTTVVRAVMEHPLQVLQHLDRSQWSDNPPPEAVLRAALQVDQIDSNVKERIRLMLDVLPQVEEARRSLSPEAQRSIDRLEENIRSRAQGQSIQAQVNSLRELRSSFRGDEGISEALEVAAQMVEDGQSSIYSPDFPFNRMIQDQISTARSAVDNIKDADVIGGSIGGAVGTFVPVLGTTAGAASMGGGASAGAAIGSFVNWIRRR